MALAKVDENIPYIELHKTGLTDAGWAGAGTITFSGIRGRITAILQQNGTLYGFVKTGAGGKDAFFSVPARDGANDGGWDRQGYDTIDGGFSAAMAVDANTAVLYTASPYFGLQVFDVQTNQSIPTSPRDNPLGAYFPYGGIWTDWAHGRILLSMNGKDDSIPRIGFYQVSISG